MNERLAHTVLLTDYAWADLEIEREIIEGAGFRLVTGRSSSPPPPETITQMARDHQPAAILTCWAQVSADAIAACPNLRIITRLGIGLDNISVAEATRRGVWVTNVPTYCLEEVPIMPSRWSWRGRGGFSISIEKSKQDDGNPRAPGCVGSAHLPVALSAMAASASARLTSSKPVSGREYLLMIRSSMQTIRRSSSYNSMNCSRAQMW